MFGCSAFAQCLVSISERRTETQMLGRPDSAIVGIVGTAALLSAWLK
jgi:hypothetical protein